MQRTLKIGTRGSKLALWQAHFVRDLLKALSGYTSIDVVVIRTEADEFQDKQIEAFGGKSVFVKEIQEALLDHRIDLAVHSLKDMSATAPQGLICAAYLGDADRRDVLLTRKRVALDSLEESARIATGSPRRIAQLKLLQPAWRFIKARGNVDTRIRKLHDGEYDALVLAAAGLERLELTRHIAHYFSPLELVPCGGQGIIAIEMREEDTEDIRIVQRLNQESAQEAALIEFGILRELGAGCRTPVGVFARIENGKRKVSCFLSQELSEMHVKLSIEYPIELSPEQVSDDFSSRLKQEWKKKTGQALVL